MTDKHSNQNNIQLLEPLSSQEDSNKRATRSTGTSINKTYYSSFSKNDIKYNIGDTIITQNPIMIFKIISIYSDEKQERLCHAKQFSSCNDVDSFILNNKKLKISIDEHELLYHTGPGVELLLDEIEGKCTILSRDTFDAIKDTVLKPVYFCNRSFDVNSTIINDRIDFSIVEKGIDIQSSEKITKKQSIITPSAKQRITKKSINPKHTQNQTQESSDDSTFAEVENENSISENENENSVCSEGSLESEEEAEIENKQKGRTPKNKKATPRRKSLSARKQGVLFRHPMPEYIMPDITPMYPPVTPFSKARDRLVLSYLPRSLPGRQDEFDEILEHLESLLSEKSGSCIYISGVPGTGKTATVMAVIQELKNKVHSQQLPSFKFVEINGMKLSDPTQAYQVLWQKLSGEKVSSAHAVELLQKRFSKNSPDAEPCVLLMDELDLLLTRNQKVIYNFFEWPNLANSRLIVVSIANTMDLPERALSNKISSRLELKRIVFAPYSYSQLVQIVKSRLTGVNIFNGQAIEYCARKVASVSGDARRALAICRRATELAEDTLLPEEDDTISRDIIHKVIMEMFSSPAIQAIRKASLHQRIFLVSLLKTSRADGKSEVKLEDVLFEHSRICNLNSIIVPNQGELVSLSGYLYSFRFILCEASKIGDPSQRIRLNISEEDLITAIKNEKDEDPCAFLKRIVEC